MSGPLIFCYSCTQDSFPNCLYTGIHRCPHGQRCLVEYKKHRTGRLLRPTFSCANQTSHSQQNSAECVYGGSLQDEWCRVQCHTRLCARRMARLLLAGVMEARHVFCPYNCRHSEPAACLGNGRWCHSDQFCDLTSNDGSINGRCYDESYLGARCRRALSQNPCPHSLHNASEISRLGIKQCFWGCCDTNLCLASHFHHYSVPLQAVSSAGPLLGTLSTYSRPNPVPTSTRLPVPAGKSDSVSRCYTCTAGTFPNCLHDSRRQCSAGQLCDVSYIAQQTGHRLQPSLACVDGRGSMVPVSSTCNHGGSELHGRCHIECTDYECVRRAVTVLLSEVMIGTLFCPSVCLDTDPSDCLGKGVWCQSDEFCVLHYNSRRILGECLKTSSLPNCQQRASDSRCPYPVQNAGRIHQEGLNKCVWNCCENNQCVAQHFYHYDSHQPTPTGSSYTTSTTGAPLTKTTTAPLSTAASTSPAPLSTVAAPPAPTTSLPLSSSPSPTKTTTPTTATSMSFPSTSQKTTTATTTTPISVSTPNLSSPSPTKTTAPTTATATSFPSPTTTTTTTPISVSTPNLSSTTTTTKKQTSLPITTSQATTAKLTPETVTTSTATAGSIGTTKALDTSSASPSPTSATTVSANDEWAILTSKCSQGQSDDLVCTSLTSDPIGCQEKTTLLHCPWACGACAVMSSVQCQDTAMSCDRLVHTAAICTSNVAIYTCPSTCGMCVDLVQQAVSRT